MHTQLSSKKRRLSWWLITAALIAALLATTTAFAEGEEPADPPESEPAAAETEAPPAEQAPAESPPEEAAPPPEEGTPAESPPEETAPPPEEGTPAESPPEETAPPPEEGTPADSPPEEPAAEAGVEMVEAAEAVDVVEEIAVELAEADITLVDGDGEALDMSSVETAQEIVVADPWFTAGSQTYRWLPFSGNCAAYPGDICVVSPTDTPIQDMLDYIQTTGTIPNYGKVYIEAGSFPENVHLDGTLGPGIPPYLSLLKGMYGAGAGTNPLVDTIINGDLEINHTTSGFTLQGLTVLGEIHLHDNSGTLRLKDVEASNPKPGGSGIMIGLGTSLYHNGHVYLEEVKADNNNHCGAGVLATGNITITNSSFDHNNATAPAACMGLYVDCLSGKVSVNGISASDNNGNGMQLFSAPGGVTIRNSVFNNNYDTIVMNRGWGLNINSNGNVTLENVQANGNEYMGVHVDALKNISVKNLGINNTSSGPGAHLHTDNGSGSVTLNGAFFQNNTGFGLLVQSSKSITVNSLWANNNSGYGVMLDNWLSGSGSGNVSVKTLAGTFTNQFNNNLGGHGIEIATRGHVYLYDFEAGYNGVCGVSINNSYGLGNVVLKSTLPSWTNATYVNGSHGYEIYSNGSISLNKTSAWHNSGCGAALENWFSPSIKPVTVTYGSFGNNGDEGLNVLARGTIKLEQVDAQNNQGAAQSGAYLNNTWGNGSVYVYGGSNGNSFSDNDKHGLEIYSNGSISLNNISAWQNGGYGVALENWFSPSIKPVTVKYGSFGNNGDEGLNVLARGTIKLEQVNAHNNRGASQSGAYLNNTWGNGSVYVYGDDFSDNDNYGLYINTNGYAKVYRIHAYNNHNTNVIIIAGKAVTVKDVDSGNSSVGSGLDVWSTDTIYVGNFHTYDNSRYGIVLDNTAAGSAKNVTLKNIDSYNNGNNGVNIDSWGSVYFYDVNSGSNWGGSGAYVNTCHDCGGCLGSGSVYISGSWNDFSDNQNRGLEIRAAKTISIKNVRADWNGSDGAFLFNSYSTSSSSVKVSATKGQFNNFRDNNGRGLDVSSHGTISVSYIDASNNIGEGAYLDNSLGNLKSLTVKKARFERNEGDGLVALSRGQIKLYNVEARDNSIHHSGQINFANETVYEFFNQNEPDEWHFFSAGPTLTVTIELNSSHFDAYLELYDSNGNLVAWDDNSGSGGGGPDALITLIAVTVPLGGTGDYYIHAFGVDGRPGTYQLALNDPTYSNKTHYRQAGACLYNQYPGSTGGVSIKSNEFRENTGTGLDITTNGTVYLNAVNSETNGGDGAHIYDQGFEKSVTVKKSSFRSNFDSGFDLTSMGNVSLSYITANDNYNYGAYIDACNDTGSGCTGFGYVKISGSGNEFSNNQIYDGLHVDSAGTVTITNVTAQWNSVDNVYVNNAYGALPKTISLKNVKSSGGGSAGCAIFGSGNVTVNTLIAQGSGGYGLYIDNTHLGALHTVTIYKVKLGYNWNDNLRVETYGNVTLGGIDSVISNGYGAVINNQYMGATGKVTLSSKYGENYFSFNNQGGLYISSNNDVALNKVNAISNSGDGVNVNTQGYVTVKYAQTINNGMNGMYVLTTNGAYIYKMWSANNSTSGGDDDGLHLDVGPAPVSIRYSNFTGNEGNGIEVIDATSLNLTGTSYFGNDTNMNGDSNLYWH